MRLSRTLPLAVLVCIFAEPAQAKDSELYGSVVDGLRLGLTVTPSRSVLPSDLEVRITLQNTSSSRKSIPISTCHSISWASYARLLVRTDGGKTYRLAFSGMVDTADLHPHIPLELAPSETLTVTRRLTELAEHFPAEDADLGLAEKLLSAKQIELAADFFSSEKGVPKLRSGQAIQRFGLSPIDKPLSTGCVAQIATSYHVACALNRAGTPYCWGDTEPGFNPDTKRHEVSIPRAITRLRKGVRSLSFGTSELCTITTEGVFCVRGGNDSVSVNRLTLPYRIYGLPPSVARLWTGSADQCAQTDAGALWCWGRSFLSAPPGSVGTEWRAKEHSALGHDVTSVVMGAQHACAQKRDGSVFCWGENKAGQIGNGTLVGTEDPTLVSGFGGPIRQLAAGHNFTCGLREDGQVLCFGKNEYGALGKDIQTAFSRPFVRSDLGKENVALFAAQNQLCAQKLDGKLVCMGVVAQDSQRLTTQTPQLVERIPSELSAVSFGPRDTCTLSKQGQVHCYGETPGAMKLPDEPSPPAGAQPIIGLSDVASVQLGHSFFCALTRAGKVSCWGDGSGGQLGAGKLTMAKRPIGLSIPCDD